MPRLERLLSMLEKTPQDAFLLYGVALEYRKSDQARAIAYLDRVIEVDPGYCYAYYQKGQALEAIGDTEAARATYRQGIEAARRVGDAKAEGELRGAFDLL